MHHIGLPTAKINSKEEEEEEVVPVGAPLIHNNAVLPRSAQLSSGLISNQHNSHQLQKGELWFLSIVVTICNVSGIYSLGLFDLRLGYNRRFSGCGSERNKRLKRGLVGGLDCILYDIIVRQLVIEPVDHNTGRLWI